MNIYKTVKTQNDDTNVTTRPFFFIWKYFILHYKRMQIVHKATPNSDFTTLGKSMIFGLKIGLRPKTMRGVGQSVIWY